MDQSKNSGANDMSKLKEVRWGIIGCGDVTEVKSGPALQNAQGSNLVAVMRRTAGLAEDYAHRHNVPRWYQRAEKLISDPEVNAVYIATPPGSHMEYALQVCRAGKPVYVEKPMARNLDECQKMVRAFENADLPLFVAYYRRALDRFLKAKGIVEAGQLGQITEIRYQYASQAHLEIDPKDLPWPVQAVHSGGGLFLDVGSHTLDILDFIFGPIAQVAGLAANMAKRSDVEDVVVMHFRTESGVLGVASWNFAAGLPSKQEEIEIFGTAGKLSLTTFGNRPVRLHIGQSVQEFASPQPEHIQQPLIQTVVDELLGRGKCPSTGKSGARTSGVMDKSLESYYGQRSEGFWNRPETWPGRG